MDYMLKYPVEHDFETEQVSGPSTDLASGPSTSHDSALESQGRQPQICAMIDDTRQFITSSLEKDVRLLPKHTDIPGINIAAGLNLFEGDIKQDSRTRNAIISPQYRWPLIVPYYLENSLEINAKGVILKAFERYRLKTCIDFKPWNGENNYVSVFRDNGCYSYVGMQNGKQQLSIGPGCDTVEIVQHEVLHALGFYHEQSRSDRDDYVTILWKNIQFGMDHNFFSYSDTETTFLGVPYDYTSVMHYSSTAFSATGNPTLQTKKAAFNNLVGKQMDLSAKDALKLNRLYNCSSSLTFLDSCSFESDDICGMIQSTNDNTDWEYVSSVPEGPNTDHTHMGKGTGYFMHFNTSIGKTGDEAILESRLFYAARGFQCLEFFYYHSGNESDQLNIWIKEYTNDSPNGNMTFVNSVTGPPADYWQIHHSKLSAKNKFRFVFQGIKGGGDSAGGFSIDDINLSETECPQNVWHIRNFTPDLLKSSLFSPPYYSKDGYAYQISLTEYPWSGLPFNIATFVYLVSGANDATLQWPCPWRQVTVEFIDQNPNAQERTSNMKSITTDPNEFCSNRYYVWDNPAVNGQKYTYPNGTAYNRTGGNGEYLFTAEEWLYRRDFLKGGDAFISISMEDISHLTMSQPLPVTTSSTTLKSTSTSSSTLNSTSTSPSTLNSTSTSPSTLNSTSTSPSTLKSTSNSSSTFISASTSPSTLKSTSNSSSTFISASTSPSTLKSTSNSSSTFISASTLSSTLKSTSNSSSTLNSASTLSTTLNSASTSSSTLNSASNSSTTLNSASNSSTTLNSASNSSTTLNSASTSVFIQSEKSIIALILASFFAIFTSMVVSAL
ncbi:meprin A subunit beta-like [Bufo gargarizans]|uniref:meprin A subunit beta-like n=1 Tax=Bufo gargarizans TaxID=30331 RepID=UPI001CF410A2|nr:meprin A subunit beta-like [Bufo gargarizans]